MDQAGAYACIDRWDRRRRTCDECGEKCLKKRSKIGWKKSREKNRKNVLMLKTFVNSPQTVHIAFFDVLRGVLIGAVGFAANAVLDHGAARRLRGLQKEREERKRQRQSKSGK